MDTLPNSLSARDIAYLVHPQTNLKRHEDLGPIVFTSGKGVWLRDDEGNEFLDAMSGLWCASLGYSTPRLAEVAKKQMETMAYSHLYKHRSHGPAVELAEKLLSIAPANMAKVHFQNSGSEANDVAIKLAWYYFDAIGKPEKRKVISRHAAYHGSSVATVSLTGKPDMHVGFNLPLAGFLHTDQPYFYRDGQEGETEEAYASRLAAYLDAFIEKEGPETVAVFFAEPVMGSSGAIAPPATYFDKVQKVLKKHDVLFVADEVITGFGRTGNMWGSETFNLEPDIITCAKALSAGALPISALMMSERVYQALRLQSEKLGNFAHGHTYGGHPACASVALETLRIYDEMDLPNHCKRLGHKLEQVLQPLEQHGLVGSVEVTGFIAGIEIAQDPLNQKPFPPESDVPGKIEQAAVKAGLIVKSIGSRICMAPPFIITDSELDALGERLVNALNTVEADLV